MPAEKGTSEGFPFDEDTLVFKVMDKMFALTNLEGELRINLKNHPEKNIELREHNPSIIPGFHMNKKYWNTVIAEATSVSLLKELIDESYQIVVEKLPKKIQIELNKL